jgi:hypothetical protein
MSVLVSTYLFWWNKALALAAINNTMTRVNAIFEKIFAVKNGFSSK